MGYIGTYGTAATAPIYHCSTFGTPKWSGKHQDEFTVELERDLFIFIKQEATRKGHNDRVNGDVGVNMHFFDEQFLCGRPNRYWIECYMVGADTNQSPNLPCLDEVWPSMPI
ncbi:hypothetical protein [Shewanella frigidimarina]|uniref:hypothetical protein n=1 Tax=Shewanella frigidimarina TaxID=56812 RepID=UPI003D79292A